MDILNLLEQARRAGVTVSFDGERLHLRGPRAAADIVARLQIHRDDVIAALTAPSPVPEPEPADSPLHWLGGASAPLRRRLTLEDDQIARVELGWKYREYEAERFRQWLDEG